MVTLGLYCGLKRMPKLEQVFLIKSRDKLSHSWLIMAFKVTKLGLLVAWTFAPKTLHMT